MGTSTEIACKDCKTTYYLGYGSYGGDAFRKLRFPIEQHMGHKLLLLCDEMEYQKDGHLYCEHFYVPDELLIENYSTYTEVNLEDTSPVFIRNLEAIQSTE